MLGAVDDSPPPSSNALAGFVQCCCSAPTVACAISGVLCHSGVLSPVQPSPPSLPFGEVLRAGSFSVVALGGDTLRHRCCASGVAPAAAPLPLSAASAPVESAAAAESAAVSSRVGVRCGSAVPRGDATLTTELQVASQAVVPADCKHISGSPSPSPGLPAPSLATALPPPAPTSPCLVSSRRPSKEPVRADRLPRSTTLRLLRSSSDAEASPCCSA